MNQTRFNNRIQFLAQFAYVGSAFHGVQEQPRVNTVLGALRKRIEDAALQKAHALYVAARTDRGVHALQNFATFYLRPPVDIGLFAEKVFHERNDGLYAVSLTQVAPTVHARGSSRGKIYRYSIKDGCPQAPVSSHPFAWEIAPILCLSAMQKAAELLIGSRDFSSFRGGGCQAGSPIKHIIKIDIIKSSHGFVFIEIWGNGFLRKMIRNMVGLLAEIGAGIKEPECIPEVLGAKKRSAAGIMAPGHALCLVKVLGIVNN